MKVLKYLGNDSLSSLEQCVTEITERFEIGGVDQVSVIEEMKESYANASQDNYDAITMDLVYSFIEKYIFSV